MSRNHSAFYRQFAPAPSLEQKQAAHLLQQTAEHGYAENPVVDQATKVAIAAVKTGLHLDLENVHSNLVEYPKAMTSQTSVLNDATKLAQATQVLSQLSDCVGELRSACQTNMKVAAALAGAIKLAQDGLIECVDIFHVAHEAIVNGTVKLAAMEDAFTANPGELAGPATQAAQLDPLTAMLRSLRHGDR
jgi:hypothetical protein